MPFSLRCIRLPLAMAMLLVLTAAGSVRGQAVNVAPEGWEVDSPVLSSLVDFNQGQSDLRVAVERFDQDRRALLRRYDVLYSPVLRQRLRERYSGWLAQLESLNFEALNREGQIDFILLRNRIEFEQSRLDEEELAVSKMGPLVPFADDIRLLQENRRNGERAQGRVSADALSALAATVEGMAADLRSEDRFASSSTLEVTPVVANRAADWVESMERTLESWYTFAAGYDPDFTWWAAAPYDAASSALIDYASAVRDELGRTPGAKVVVGQPIGEEGLRAHLRHEMIPYSAEELIAIAQTEFAWMEEALRDAAREMGFGDDWRAAQESVKEMAVDPGEKPGVIVDLAAQSRAFITENAGITVPPLAREIWRIEMMSPERQLVSPFFLGGEIIRVSYPTNTMTHEQKLMSMRGNNPHFNRATVHHELIPGHHLQGFMRNRFNGHRDLFNTPFWGEGWALYWEMLLWERDFPRGPEDRIGMLFWRMHRAARIIFSLSYHLEQMSPQEAVDFLVDRVGHERANAEAEVRRSFQGNYSPLYQVAYMIGGMQFRALHRDLVEDGVMDEAQFHDTVLQGGVMPVGMVRARLDSSIELDRGYWPDWRFAGTPDPVPNP